MSFHPRILGLLALVFGVVAGMHAEVKIGDPFPSLETTGPHAGEIPATTGKVVLVDFWASWCAPCKASFPALAALHQEYAPQGLLIVAVSVDEKPAAYTAFIARFSPPFITVQDHDQKLVSTVKVPVMPTSYLLDRHGRVRFLHEGFHGRETETSLRRQIEMLLAEHE